MYSIDKYVCLAIDSIKRFDKHMQIHHRISLRNLCKKMVLKIDSSIFFIVKYFPSYIFSEFKI